MADASKIEFDSTLGYPGEGPPTEIEIVGWNCAGIRDESSDKLNQLLRWFARRRSSSIMLLQEHHLKAQQCEDARMLLRQLGVESRFDPRNDDSASRGTAVLVHVDAMGISRENVSFRGGRMAR